MPIHVEIRTTPFEPFQELHQYQEGLKASSLEGKYGANAIFIGTMRDFNEGDDVKGMTLEHYPEMTERHLNRIVQEAMEKWPLLDALLLHRVGELHPNDPIVLIAVWSAHRAASFEACRFIMEDLKSRAPFWKKEILDTGERWVEKNTPA